MQDQYSRTQLLLGAEAMEKLHHARVAVFGIGGVGGYTVEASPPTMRNSLWRPPTTKPTTRPTTT